MGWPVDLTWYKVFQDQGSFVGGVFALIAGLAAYIGAVRAARMQVKAMRQQMASAQRSADEQIVAVDRQIGEMRAQAAAQERQQSDQRREQRYALALAIRSEQIRISNEIGLYENALRSLSPEATLAPPSDYREIPVNDVLRSEWRAGSPGIFPRHADACACRRRRQVQFDCPVAAPRPQKARNERPCEFDWRRPEGDDGPAGTPDWRTQGARRLDAGAFVGHPSGD